MHRTHSPRRELAIRVLKYLIMILLILGGVILSLFWAMGYRFNFGDRQISRIALLQFGSFPNNANIDINGSRISASTPTRLNVGAGEITVQFSRDGYRNWQRTVYMSPGQVKWLNYARLIPNTITTNTIHEFTDVKQMLVSPDRNWLAIRTSDGRYEYNHEQLYYNEVSYEMPLTLILADISNPENVRFSNLEVPAGRIRTPVGYQTEKFEIIEWGSDSRHILARHVVGELEDFLLIDRRNPSQTRNLSQNLNQNDTEATLHNMRFAANSRDGLWALSSDDNCLVRITPSNNFISEAIECGISDFVTSSDNKIAFVSIASTGAGSESELERKSQTVKVYDGRSVTSVREFDESAVLMIAMTRFNRQDFLAISEGEIVKIHKNPVQNLISSQIYLSSPGGIDWLSVSPGGRFLAAGRHGRIVSYNFENHSDYSFEINDSAAPHWLDGYRLITSNNGQIQMIEFDGANRENIVSGFGQVTLSRNERFLFSLGDLNGGVVLQRSRLVI